jgi:hypothetical protein
MHSPSGRIQFFHVASLLGLLIIGYGSLELFFYRWSVGHNPTRILLMNEYRRTLNLKRHDSSGGLPTMLLAGNSCLEYGVDLVQLQQSLSNIVQIQRLMVLASTYEDWYYGLEEIFRQGSRPQYVALMLSPMQLSLNYPPSELSTVYLYTGSNLGRVADDQHLNPTERATLYVTHYSPFWGSREAMRYWKQRALPGYEHAMKVQAQRLSGQHDIQLDPKRIQDLKLLCAQYNSELILVIPPTGQPADTVGANQVHAAASSVGVSMLQPLPNTSVDRSYYQDDGFHLNAKGARLFTTLLGEALLQPIHSAFADLHRNKKPPVTEVGADGSTPAVVVAHSKALP